ncbi:sugar ABC transporter substrate-binding protein [Zobellia laminariae]|uniref:sugar ABC transporter substrate-binding protein n=1 Tax=Zobellia laminariae TaxID=248906 RepID=UPI004056F38C
MAFLMVPLFFREAEIIAEKCKETNIKVATFNNYVNQSKVDFFIGQDLYQSGKVAASLFYILIKEKANLAILHIDESFQNASHMQEKERGFIDYFKINKSKEVKIHIHHLKKEDGFSIEKTITNFKRKNAYLDGIFVTTSKAYLLANGGRVSSTKPILVGYDLVEKNIAHLKEGNISFLIHQDPKKQVYLSLTSLVEYFLFDNPFRKQLLLPIDIINAENYSYYLA